MKISFLWFIGLLACYNLASAATGEPLDLQYLKIANGFLSYTAAYKLKGNVLTVKRTLDDRTKGNVCSPQVMLEYHCCPK